MSKYLILGGAGFMGSNLTHALVARGERPRIFTRPSYTLSNLKPILDDVELHYGDFLDDVAVRRALKDVETIFHLISTTFPSMTIESSVYDLMSNLLPTIRLTEACIANGVKKIIYASSGGTIYGEPQTIPIREDHPLVPKSAYGQSKLIIESYLSFHARSSPLDVNILRVSNPFGPRQNPYGVQGLVAVAMGCALHDRVLNIYGQGDAIRDYIYIDDVVKAMLLAAGKAGSSLVNISSATGTSVLDMVRTIEEMTGCMIRKKSIPSRPGDVEASILSNDRALEIYGWRPTIGLQEGLSKTWEWMTLTNV